MVFCVMVRSSSECFQRVADMGLGKTLQALCAIAVSSFEQNSLDGVALPSIVVCPATLVRHWKSEISSFIPASVLDPVIYSGSRSERDMFA